MAPLSGVKKTTLLQQLMPVSLPHILNLVYSLLVVTSAMSISTSGGKIAKANRENNRYKFVESQYADVFADIDKKSCTLFRVKCWTLKIPRFIVQFTHPVTITSSSMTE